MNRKRKTLHPAFGEKHKAYIKKAVKCTISVAEGAVRAGKTIDNITAFAYCLEKGTPDRIHLRTGSTVANAKLNIGDANGFGLEYIFKGRCKWGEYKGNDCLKINIRNTQYIVIFSGGAKADSYKKIRGNSYGMWIATEINLHHDNMIKECLNRQLASKNRKIFWDLNPSDPNHFIYSTYIDRYAATMGQKYNYEHFTIKDNINISQERIDEIEAQYDPASIWYRRDILGERCVAEGLVYQYFADNAVNGKFVYKFKDEEKPNRINIGVDFGGTGSAHAFVAVGYSGKNVIVLASERPPADGDPLKLYKTFERFCYRVFDLYGEINAIYCDSAEQVLIRGLIAHMRQSKFRWVADRIHNARKIEINDRIRLVNHLMYKGLFFYTENAHSVRDALLSARYDDKKQGQDIRLDNGTTDIDSLDALEYSIERDYKRLLKL